MVDKKFPHTENQDAKWPANKINNETELNNTKEYEEFPKQLEKRSIENGIIAKHENKPEEKTQNAPDDWLFNNHENKLSNVDHSLNRSFNDWIVVSSREKKWLNEENSSQDIGQCQNYACSSILFNNTPSDNAKSIKLEDFGNCPYPFTITNGTETERTYDEPCVDLPRSRSWLCCPGSRPVGAPPPLQTPEELPTMEPVTTPPVPQCTEHCAKIQQQLDEQAQRYEEQLTELHSVIAELTRKLHQQRAMAITEEDEASEICTSAHDDSITCPLEVSELEPLENDLSDTETKLPLADSPSELPDPKLNASQHEQNELLSSKEENEALRAEIQILRKQLNEAQTQLAQSSSPECLQYQKNSSAVTECAIENENDVIFLSDEKIDIKSSAVVPVHKTNSINNKSNFSPAPVAKMAERVKLRRATEEDKIVSSTDLVNSGVSTAVAEHLVGDILRQCDQPERQSLELELRRLSAKLEHSKAQNAVLALTLADTKEHCDRMALLCGKYESNAVALRLALGLTDRAIEAYDVLLALLETELSIDQNDQETLDNRGAAENVAKQLLVHLDTHQKSDVLLSPWQHSIYPNSTVNSEPWTAEHETRLREHVSRLKQERSTIQGTYVNLESTHLENIPAVSATNQEMRKMDLEMAVLLQELMGLREDKSELLTKLFMLEKEKGSCELKLKYVEGQQRAQAAALKNLQGQLKDTEGLLAIATQNKEQDYSDAEHAQGIEFELMQALARESRLKIRLQELVTTLEQVTKNAEARLLEGKELVHDLNQTNSVLVETVDRNYRKYQSRLKKMEHQMLTLVERHNTQVHSLKQRIAELESPRRQINSSGNSETSL